MGGHTVKRKVSRPLACHCLVTFPNLANIIQKIVHAGHHRYVVRRNPKRYDEFGDELEDDEEDAQADAAAAESNPYSDIKLECAT